MTAPLTLNLHVWPRGLTVAQAAAYTGLPVETFRREALARGLRPRLFQGRPRYDRVELDRKMFDDAGAIDQAESAADWAAKISG